MTARFGEQRKLMVKIFAATLKRFGEPGVDQRKSAVQRTGVSVALFGRDVVVAGDLGPHLNLTAAEIHDVRIRVMVSFASTCAFSSGLTFAASAVAISAATSPCRAIESFSVRS
jgi:hypothetical protein